MVLCNIYLLPHGDEIIDMPGEGSVEMNRTISRVVENDESDVLVIASPHGVKLSKNIPVVNTEHFESSFKVRTRELHRNLLNEKPLTDSIIKHTEDESEEVGFVTTSGDKSVFPLDFGTLIPLDFFHDKPLVYLGQSRIKDRDKLSSFGKKLYKVLNEYEKKVSLIISADQAHTHSGKGPYGYSEEAAEYEKIVVECIKKNDFRPLLKIDEAMISKAKPDSYWNLVILSSVLRESGRHLELDYHYVEEYFGMLCAHSYM